MSDNGSTTIIEELESLRREIELLTGLTSRWNGNVILAPADAPYRGLKPFRCDVHLRADLVYAEVRWRTLIHELLHSVSAGYNQTDYNALKGWEEGVIEQTQRLLRGRILRNMGVIVDEAVFAEVEQEATFNAYIEVL